MTSCQERFHNDFNKEDLNNYSQNFTYEKFESVDFNNYIIAYGNVVDFYTFNPSNINFNEKINKIKINNYEKKLEENHPINLIYNYNNIYSINHNGEILEFNTDNKLVNRYIIDHPIENTLPVSFTLINNDFIIAFKSGEIIRTNNIGEVIWVFNNNSILNTPIKYNENNLIALYANEIIFISADDGNIIFKKKYNSNNIIQSTGGQIVNFFNLIYFILPNSIFKAIDTFLYDEHETNLNNMKLNTSINNLDDKIHIYNNLLIYLDNKNTLYTYDILKNKYLLSDYRIENIDSFVFFSNSLIIKNDQGIYFLNIKNGNLFSEINFEKKLKKDVKIIDAILTNNLLHLFLSNGKLVLINKNLDVENEIDLKINKIKKIFNYQDTIFVSTSNGTTYLYK